MDNGWEDKADSQNWRTFYQKLEATRTHCSPYNHVMNTGKPYKIPRSALVVIYTAKLEVLLIERADYPGYWQSVTGSLEAGETLTQTARREVMEETGIDATQEGVRLDDWQRANVYAIYPIWQHRYEPGVSYNTEHVFGLQIPDRMDVTLSAREHLQYVWLPYEKAAPLCFSPTNRDAILDLPRQIETSVNHPQVNHD